VVINNFNVFRTSFGPAEAHPKLLVDSNAMLTSTITRQRLQLRAIVGLQQLPFPFSSEAPYAAERKDIASR